MRSRHGAFKAGTIFSDLRRHWRLWCRRERCFEQRLAVVAVVGLRLAAVATSLGVHRRGPGARGKRGKR